jgi:hypothetical protein
MLRGFSHAGGVCPECGTLQVGSAAACRVCGTGSKPVELGEALTDRVIGAGGGVKMVAAHPGLARAGGVAALLRYSL